MSGWRHRFRTYFEAGGFMDIMGQSEAGAQRAAISFRRMLGYKGPELRPTGPTQDLGHLGTDGAYCPRCRPTLFPVREAVTCAEQRAGQAASA